MNLKNLAMVLGVKNIYVKDESKRAKLNSFKMLGATYAIGKFLCQKLGVHIEDTSFEYLKSMDARRLIGEITFCYLFGW